MGNVWETARYSENFARRHIGPSATEKQEMLKALGFSSLDELITAAVPKSILDKDGVAVGAPATEPEALAELKAKMSQNRIFRSFLGMGYNDCFTPGVIQRNILENPAWYTQYTPYQAEIAQGRLEALMNYQTMVSDLTGFPIANASLLDEGTAAAEAMNLCRSSKAADATNVFYVAADCHPQTIDVVRTRAEPLGIDVRVAHADAFDFGAKPFGILLQYPTTEGALIDYRALIKKAHDAGALVTLAADLLSLALVSAPAELGADIAVGNTQRFGVPMGYGGPHAAYFATRDEYKRKIPGRIIGVSKDARGKNAYRLSLQTREQHIRRDKATSNICTAQVLLAIMASMYAVYHGPEGVKKIASRVNALAMLFAKGAEKMGLALAHKSFFDTVTLAMDDAAAQAAVAAAAAKGINVRFLKGRGVGVAFDETSTVADVEALLAAVGGKAPGFSLEKLAAEVTSSIPATLTRSTAYLTHAVFNSYHSETEMQRYIRMLEARDLSLTRSMIPLGSCTMKLNAASELYPITWPEVGKLHPFVPADQAKGYAAMFRDLETWIAELTGFAAVSLQPNSGAQGEYAGLLVIRKYHMAQGAKNRTVCLIPSSAHGTNPASAALAGMQVVVVRCDADGNIDIADLQAKASQHAANLAALMITYPSTHGVFEEGIREICDVIHKNGGLVYMDGANLNAQIGLCKPGHYGPDVIHLNLHKTFCIPHGGGGPGMGPIAVSKALAPYLPNHPVVTMGGEKGVGAVSAAPWGSPSILPISWMYIRMMGGAGLREATQTAILNANYVAKRLAPHYPIVYTGRGGLVAHECIIDLTGVKKSADIEVDDIAKRLIDYGFHAPTVSWPVPGSMMIEPTESESKAELDRFCDAMIAIRKEIKDVEEGKAPREGNVLKHAPHTADSLTDAAWDRPYSRETAVFPAAWVKQNKFWPFVSRIDNAYGDRNLVCTCPPLDEYEDDIGT